MQEIPSNLQLEVHKELVLFGEQDEVCIQQRESDARLRESKSVYKDMESVKALISLSHSTDLHTLVMYLYSDGFPEGSNILEIECNYGLYLRFLSKKYENLSPPLNLIGVDHDRIAVGFGQHKGELDIRQLNPLNMPEIPSNSQDFVLSNYFLDGTEHFFTDQSQLDQAIREAYRVLKTGGHLLITAHYLNPKILKEIGFSVIPYYFSDEYGAIPFFGRLYDAVKN